MNLSDFLFSQFTLSHCVFPLVETAFFTNMVIERGGRAVRAVLDFQIVGKSFARFVREVFISSVGSRLRRFLFGYRVFCHIMFIRYQCPRRGEAVRLGDSTLNFPNYKRIYLRETAPVKRKMKMKRLKISKYI